MPDAPVLLFAIVAALCLVVSFVLRTWWRGVNLSLFIFAIVLFALAFFVYTAQRPLIARALFAPHGDAGRAHRAS